MHNVQVINILTLGLSRAQTGMAWNHRLYIKGNGGSGMQFYQSVKVGGAANYSAAPPVRGAFHIPLQVP
jgi:hypothetical protein